MTHPHDRPSPLFWEALQHIGQHRDVLVYQPKQHIYFPPDQLFLVCRGIVQLVTVHCDGTETVLGIAGSSGLLGTSLTKITPYWAVALTDVLLFPLFWSDIESSPFLGNVLFRTILQRLQHSESWVAVTGRRQVEDRLKQMLVLLAQEFGQAIDAHTIELKFSWTHQQMANAIGSTRVTVNRLIHQFKGEGWLQNHYRRWFIQRSILQEFQ